MIPSLLDKANIVDITEHLLQVIVHQKMTVPPNVALVQRLSENEWIDTGRQEMEE